MDNPTKEEVEQQPCGAESQTKSSNDDASVWDVSKKLKLLIP